MNNRRIPDFDSVARAALSASPGLLQQWFPAGRLSGRELAIGDLAGNPGDSCRINVETGKWADFATDHRGGDLVSLYAAMRGLEQGRACHELAGELGLVNGHEPATSNGAAAAKANGPAPKAKPAASGRKKVTWTPIHPVPDTAPRPSHHHFEYGEPSAVWTYTDADGRVVGYICRFEKAKGKEIVPQSWCRGDNGKFEWRWLSFAKPRPIYGLQALAARPDATVVLVEGEKTADAGARLLPKAVVVTFPGGSKAWRYVDWSPLKGRKVIVVPDADGPGCDAFDGYLDNYGVWKPGIAQELQSIAAGVRVVQPPDGVAPGWDLADALAEGWSPEQTEQFIRRALRHPSKPPTDPPPADDGDPVLVNDDSDRGAPDYGDPPPDDGWHGGPDQFAPVPLGYDRTHYYYLAAGTRQITALSAGQHNKSGMMSLAGLSRFWERTWFFARNGVAWDTAADSLMRACEARGFFNPANRRRGRGVWIEDGHAVVNMGDSLIVDGQEMPFNQFRSRYVYEAGEPVSAKMESPLTDAEARKLLTIAQSLRWQKPVSAELLAGWIMIAPLSGALEWRPHIWVTGTAHSGKTTVIRDIVRRALGPIAFCFDGKSSESSLRQRMDYDALPVVFDEPEQSDDGSRRMVQNVIELARISSSGGLIFKGTQNQSGAKGYLARSAMCLSSINMTLQHYQDETRFTPLVLEKNEPKDDEEKVRSEEHFQTLMRDINATLTPSFSNRLLMRSVRLLPIILDNARTFTDAVAAVMGNRRIGDQIGTMMAGAYALEAHDRLTFDQAVAWIKRSDWTDHTPVEAEKNETRLLSTIMQYQLRVMTGTGTGHDRTIGELVDAARGKDDNLVPDSANKTLRRHGIRYEPPNVGKGHGAGIWIANQHQALKRILRDTPWGTNWRNGLLSIDGAVKSSDAIRFGAGAVSRAVFLPIEVLDTS
ncbi:DUF6371 domain-containing protein [Fodinicurvata sp. EGI_FJ10296]|uniref:DUF6371 domain-containing protein n=1 Tax=Fodinicurvata sp. EGI_FJ10296 TaxID=3231908 RepID=UPI003453CD79